VVTELWNLIIVNPMMNILVFIYGLVHNYGLAVIVFTILLKLVTLPFSIQQQRSMKAQAALAPELQALQKKYAKDKERLAQEQMKLYKEKGINPLGGCLPMLIPWPIFIAFYQSVNTVMSVQPEQFLELSKHLLPSLAGLVPVNLHFLWLNLARPDPFYILPALAVITTWIQQKMMTVTSTDPQAQSMNQTMGLMMPLFMGWITLSFASGLAIYWVMFNIIGIIQQYFVTGWGELGKMLPPVVLKWFPGAVPVPMPTQAVAAKKPAMRTRRSAVGGDSDSTAAATTRRRSRTSAAAATADPSGDAEQKQQMPTAASLPPRRSKQKKQQQQ